MRIHGLETEYGLSARPVAPGGRTRLSPAEAGQVLFAPIEHEYASSNVFLRNGGRLYLDVGSHPEYATAECLDVRELVAQDRAGDVIVARLAGRAEALTAAERRPVELRLFKNNADAYGNSYGSHENYSLDRQTDLAALATLLTPFLVTRQLLCGVGRWTPDGFLVSQRADHLHDGLSSMTTRSRPLMNTRDEPLADPARFRRLHVLAGDSNLSETTQELRLAATVAVIDRIERTLAGESGLLPTVVLSDPGAALRTLARDPAAVVELADGGRITGVAVQQEYLDAVEADLPAAVASRWRRLLAGLVGDGPLPSAEIEWLAKRRLLEEFRQRHRLDWSDRRLAQVDLAFHDITVGPAGPRGLFRVLEAAGAAVRLTDDAEVEAAVVRPPEDTRAVLRSRLIEALQRQGRQYTIDWTTVAVHDLPGGRQEARLTLGDPFQTSSAEVDALIAEVAAGWRPSGGH